MIDDDIKRILEIRDQLYSKTDLDCRRELAETLDIISNLASVIGHMERKIERIKSA